jgi:hypothetical protein
MAMMWTHTTTPSTERKEKKREGKKRAIRRVFEAMCYG